jgi:hypothetical protein
MTVAPPAAARGGADHQDQDSMDKRPETHAVGGSQQSTP